MANGIKNFHSLEHFPYSINWLFSSRYKGLASIAASSVNKVGTHIFRQLSLKISFCVVSKNLFNIKSAGNSPEWDTNYGSGIQCTAIFL